jgi:Zn-dependent M28 family amino/carboxypeptidase
MKRSILLLCPVFLLILSITACAQEVQVDRDQLLRDVQILASDALEGRKTGTTGNRMAQVFIEDRFQKLGLQTFGDSYRHLFSHTNTRTEEVFTDAVNLIGYIEGRTNPDQYLVVTAHYDHLGVQNGEIYNGADDNASGTGGLMAAASWFMENQPENSLIFIAFDAEEQGLGGAYHFVENPVVPLEQIVMNVNMDMISTNFENELYAVGTYHYEYLKPMVEESVAGAPVNVLFGYDYPEADQDWTLASDHGPFHLQGIPFIYFGVEDHEHYHQPTDTFENINPDFYVNDVTTIISFIRDIDRQLNDVREASGR